MKTSDFDYHLPAELIAQHPVEPRDASRLLVLNRKSNFIQHKTFREIGENLLPGDLLVVNQSRVIPARLLARKIPTGGKVEILLLKRSRDNLWEVLVGGKRMHTGIRIEVDNGPLGQVVDIKPNGIRVIQFDEPIEVYLNMAGKTPLPPYIHTPLEDPDRYQTVYAKHPGSVAAPTAGLHFTKNLISDLISQGVNLAYVTLHIGLDTFLPVFEDEPIYHRIHTEWCSLPKETADKINEARKNGSRIVAVGTTSARVLESVVSISINNNTVDEFIGNTSLFILPGYEFKIVDALITNFHLPKSTLLMMVSAFANRQQILDAYHIAMQMGYRFYSFGDAMFIS